MVLCASSAAIAMSEVLKMGGASVIFCRYNALLMVELAYLLRYKYPLQLCGFRHGIII